MWRVNWVHPFIDGNGRVARACAYIALCRGFGSLPNVDFTLGMAGRENDYISALESAHERWARSEQDFSDVEYVIQNVQYLLDDVLWP